MKFEKKRLNVHFIGVGGASMSSLALYLASVGFDASGSDLADGEVLDRLRKKGLKVFVGHSAENVLDKQVVVYNDAIAEDNVELVAARKSGAFVLKRAELLRMISENFAKRIGVSGCHGKTTTACMLVWIFAAAKARFSAHVGGFDLKYGNCAVRGGEFFISEVCEFKKNLDFFDADVAVCLNVDADHLDCYKDFDELKRTYFNFLKRAYKSIICVDDPILREFDEGETITFGRRREADFTAAKVKGDGGKYSFDVLLYGKKIAKVALNVYGENAVEDALAAFAAAYSSGVSVDDIVRGLEGFKGVERRFEEIGKIGGARTFIDYAHHPEEISAAVKTAKEIGKGKLLVVFQPHTYSRTAYLKDRFLDVLGKIEDLTIFKTYAARERYFADGDALSLAENLPESRYFEDEERLLSSLRERAKKGDTVLILGAGDLAIKIKSILKAESDECKKGSAERKEKE